MSLHTHFSLHIMVVSLTLGAVDIIHYTYYFNFFITVNIFVIRERAFLVCLKKQLKTTNIWKEI